MEFAEVVRRRRMVRSFEDRPVSDATVEHILDHARRAPSAGFAQGTQFLVLSGPEDTTRYWEVALPPGSRDAFPWPDLLNAPVLVIVLSDKHAYLDRYAQPDKGWTDRDESRWPVPYWDVDAGFCALLMLLSAVDAGLGALFFGVFKGWDRIRDAFGIPETFHPVGVVAMGYPAGDDRPSASLRRGRKPLDEIVHRGRW